jgi:hypothetical protein
VEADGKLVAEAAKARAQASLANGVVGHPLYQEGKAAYRPLTNGKFTPENLETTAEEINRVIALINLLYGDRNSLFVENRDHIMYLSGHLAAAAEENQRLIDDANPFTFVIVSVFKDFTGVTDLETLFDSDAGFQERTLAAISIIPIAKNHKSC